VNDPEAVRFSSKFTCGLLSLLYNPEVGGKINFFTLSDLIENIDEAKNVSGLDIDKKQE